MPRDTERYFMVEVKLTDPPSDPAEVMDAGTELWALASTIASKINKVEGVKAHVSYKPYMSWRPGPALPQWPDEDYEIQHLPDPMAVVIIVGTVAAVIGAAAEVTQLALKRHADSKEPPKTTQTLYLRHGTEVTDLEKRTITKEEFEVMFQQDDEHAS